MCATSHWFPRYILVFGLVSEAEIYYYTYGAYGRTGMERLTGDTPDLSDWTAF